MSQPRPKSNPADFITSEWDMVDRLNAVRVVVEEMRKHPLTKMEIDVFDWEERLTFILEANQPFLESNRAKILGQEKRYK